MTNAAAESIPAIGIMGAGAIGLYASSVLG